MSDLPENPANADNAPPASSAPPISADFARIETLLAQIRDSLAGDTREQTHKEFSIARLVASIATAIVVGLLLWALADCVFHQGEYLGIKLLFAITLQLIALTAVVYDRQQK